MFTYDASTRLVWFNSDSLEANIEFELVGVVRTRAQPPREALTLNALQRRSC